MSTAPEGHLQRLLREAAQEPVHSNSELYCCLLSNFVVKHVGQVFTRVHLFCFQWGISGVKGYTRSTTAMFNCSVETQK